MAAFMMWREAETEPFHIDELRQVRPYGNALQELLDSSFAQEQPPLDVLVGSAFQSLVGVGDVLQRGHGMLSGVAALVFLSVMLWRSGVRAGVPVAVLVLAISPTFLSFTAYARPYALPLALMMALLLATDVWLERGSLWSGGVVVVISAVLPLSRVFEPPAFLVLVCLSIMASPRRASNWGRRPWLVVGATVSALIFVEVPIYLRLRSRLTAYKGQEPASFLAQVTRIIDESLPRLADAFGAWWFAVILVVSAICFRSTRHQLIKMWWFYPLVLTPICFFVAFHYQTDSDQQYYGRYAYYWLPPFAVVVGLLCEDVTRCLRCQESGKARRLGCGIIGLCVFGFLSLNVSAVVTDFRTPAWDDYRSLGVEIERRLPMSTAVIFDAAGTPLGSYRPGYAGAGRYTSPSRRVLGAMDLARSPEFSSGIDRYVIATRGPVLAPDGWTVIRTSRTMTLYLPELERHGALDLAADLVLFGELLPASNGAALRLAGALVAVESGELKNGCEAIDRLFAEAPSMRAKAASLLQVSDVGSRAMESCP